MSLTTSVGCPFALVRWGGSIPGQRPRTKLAFLEVAKASRGTIYEYRGRVWTKNHWAKTARVFTPEDVLKRWRTPPRLATLRRARLALRRTPADPSG